MKKFLFIIFAVLMLTLTACMGVCAAEIKLISPSVAESELMPGRDFYVIGTIDRGGKSAAYMPLNITVELFDSAGKSVRLLKSNVSPSGTTSAEYFLTDYEQGSTFNDMKGSYIMSFSPPDILFDGTDRDSVRKTHNKIVVGDNYFAAVIYGGATKSFDLKYEDAYSIPLTDINAGEYSLIVTAVDFNGNEVCKAQKGLVFANEKPRLLAKDSATVNEYAKKYDWIIPSSFPGKWIPSQFANITEDFSYYINQRLLGNVAAEYENADKIYILLNDLDKNDITTTYALGSAFNSEAQIRYLYYDIGEETIEYTFDGAKLKKSGSIVKPTESEFIQILRSQSDSDTNSYIDFDFSDGFVLTRGSETTFYGTYTPIEPVSELSGTTYAINNKAFKVYVEFTSEDGETIYEESFNVSAINEHGSISRYEFSFKITPSSEMAAAKQLYMTPSLISHEGETILIGERIPIRVNYGGEFIGGYDDTYWGRNFCNLVNNLGKSPTQVALNPDEFITRGDFAAMINRFFGYSITGKNSFSDLDEENVFYTDCMTASAIGYMTGDEKGQITAEDLISREQAIIILARISQAAPGNIKVNFKDSDEISFWAKDYVDLLCSNGIVTGFDGYLNPIDNITVAEASALIIKTLKWMYADSTVTVEEPENSETSTDISEDFDLSSTDFISDVNFDSVSGFLNANKSALDGIVKYIEDNCSNGLYVGKVGNGLEIRDYTMGNFIKLSDNSISLLSQISSKFAAFSVKYNPSVENAIHFTLGADEDGNSVGLTFTQLDSIRKKELFPIDGNWYYYVQN